MEPGVWSYMQGEVGSQENRRILLDSPVSWQRRKMKAKHAGEASILLFGCQSLK